MYPKPRTNTKHFSILNCFKTYKRLSAKQVKERLPHIKDKTISAYLSLLVSRGVLFHSDIKEGRIVYELVEENPQESKSKFTDMVNELLQEKIIQPIKSMESGWNEEFIFHMNGGDIRIAYELEVRKDTAKQIREMFEKRFL